MKKNVAYYIVGAVVLVGAVAAAYFSPAQNFQGYLKTDTKQHVAGATCVPFVTPVKGGLRRQGEMGVHSVNFKNCKDSKIKTLHYSLQAQNLDVQNLRLMRNGVDVTGQLTSDSQVKLNGLVNQFRGKTQQNYAVDLSFASPMNIAENDLYTLGMTLGATYQDSYISTSLYSVDFNNVQTSNATTYELAPTDMTMQYSYQG